MLLPFILGLHASTVTFAEAAAPASRLLPALGRAVGIPMTTDERLAREVLLIRVKDVPLDGLMKRISQVTGGEWEEKGGTYRLTMDGSTDARQRRAEAIARGEAWHQAIERYTAEWAERPDATETHAIAESVLAAFPAETIGSLDPGERIVFSTQPTSMQRPFPLGTLRGVDLTKLPHPDDPNVSGHSPNLAGQIEVVQLAIRRMVDGSMLSYSFTTADADGRVAGGEEGNIWEDRRAGNVPPRLPRPDAPIRFPPEEAARAVALSATDTLSQIGPRGGSDGESGPRYDTLYTEAEISTPSAVGRVPELLSPETTDPLSLTAGPLLARLAESQGENLVADLPDAAFVPARAPLAEPEQKAGPILSTAATQLELEFAIEDGWMVARPRRPWTARGARVDRMALGTALRSLARNGDLGLDALAAYAATQPLVGPDDTLESAVFGAVNAGYGKRMAATCVDGERETLRLYRALGSFRSNDVRTFGSLSPAARAALWSLVFNSEGGPTRWVAYDSSGQRGIMGYRNGTQSVPWTLRTERTVYWSRGVPPEATLKVSESSEPAIVGLAPSGARPRITEWGGSMTGTSHRTGTVVVRAGNPRLDHYAEATVRGIQFRLAGDPGITFSRDLEETTLIPNRPKLGYGDLPEPMRKNIEDTRARAIQMLEQMRSRNASGKP